MTDRQVAGLCKAFPNSSSKDTKLSKTQFSKIIQSGRFLGRLFGLLRKVGLSLMKHVLTSLAKSVLIPLALTAATSVADVGTHRKS